MLLSLLGHLSVCTRVWTHRFVKMAREEETLNIVDSLFGNNTFLDKLISL